MATTGGECRFRELVAPHLAALLNLARWLVGNDEDADDVVQEALVRAYRALPGYRGGAARPWLLAIVRNVAYTLLGTRRMLVPLEDADDWIDDGFAAFELDPEILYGRSDAVRRINAAVERLPLAFREVFVLREIEDLSIDTLADRTVAVLVYGRRKHVVQVFVWPADEPRLVAPQAATERGFNLASWTSAGLRYTAISDLNHEELATFQRLYRRHHAGGRHLP